MTILGPTFYHLNPISMKQISPDFRSLRYFLSTKICIPMNIATSWQRLLSLLAVAICVSATSPVFGCDVVVTGGQPIIVNIYLDPMTGTSQLSGANIAAFVQGTGPGCNIYQFYSSTDKEDYLGTSVPFGCADVSPDPVFYVVRMDDDPNFPNSGNESNPVFISVVVHDNTTPTATCPTNKTYESDDDGNDNCLFRAENGVTVPTNSLKLTWADNCGSPDYRFNGTGAWISGDNIAVPFHNFPKGLTTVNYRVTDATHTATCSFTVTVSDLNAPILNNVPDDDTIPGNVPFAQILAVYVGNLSGVTAYDSCDGVRPVVYSAVADTLDDCPVTHTILRTWTTTDLSGNTNFATQLISVMDTFAPVVAPFPSDSIIYTEVDDLDCDAYFEIDPLATAVDCSPNDSLEVKYWIDGIQVTTLDGHYAHAGSPYELRYIVLDQCGNADTTDFDLYVEDGTLPIASCATSVNLALNPAGEATLFYQMIDQGSFDNCSAFLYPFVDPFQFDCSHVGVPQPVTLYLLDDAGNGSTCISSVNIQDNTPPVITCPADRTFSCAIDEGLAGFATATDACGLGSITVEEASFNQTGPHCYDLVRVYTATDIHGNENVCQQNLTVEDNFAPVLLDVPADIEVACGTILPDPVVTAFDTCDGSHLVTPTIEIFQNSACNLNNIKYFQVRTWEATDACGNYAITQDTVKFMDFVAPDISDVPSDLTFFTNFDDCNGAISINLNNYDIFDACGNGPVTVSPATWVSTQPAGNYVFGYAAIDACGNLAHGTINVHVVDNSIPEIICQTDINVSLDNSGFHQFDLNELLISSDDNCGVVDFALSQDFATCFDASLEALGFGPVLVEVTVFDAAGNENTCAVIVHTTAPPDIAIDITNFTATDPSYFGANDGLVSIDGVAGGSGVFNYAVLDWFTGNVISPTSFNDTLTAGEYLLAVQDVQTSCIDLQYVELLDGPLPLIAADSITGAHGDIVCVAVTVQHFQNIVSVQMGISIPDATVGEVVSVVNFQPGNFDLAVLVPTPNDFTVSMMNPTTSQVDLMNGDTLFCINVELVGSLHDTTSVIIVDGSLELVSGSTGNFFNLPADDQDGFIAISSGLPAAAIEGDIVAWYGGTVALVDVDLNSGQATETTGPDGHFAFDVAVGDLCELTPSKDINYVNGVSVFDLFTIQRHILGDPAALNNNPYAIIAADANNDEIVTTFDLVELQFIILNPINADIAGNTSWRFVPADWNFTTAGDPWTPAFPESIDLGIVLADDLQNDFIAIKVGDVDGDADVLSLIGSDDRAPMLFEMNDRAISAGEVVALPVRARDFRDRLGWQMTLNFDTQLFDYQGVAAGELANISENNFGKSALADGKLTTAWFSANPVSIADNSVLFTLYFKVKKGAPSIESSIKIGSEITPAIGLDGAKNRTQPQLVWSKNSKSTALEFELSQNQPNPFGHETRIGFTLPEATGATFSIFDAAGKLVKTTTANFEKGRNEVRIDRSELSATGVYFYEVKTTSQTARKRMVLVD